MLYKRCSCDRDTWADCDHPWWYRFEVHGFERRGTTGTADRRGAEVKERAKRAFFEGQAPVDRSPAGGLAELGGFDVARAVADGVTDSQIKALKWLWGQVVKHLGSDTHPRVITYERVQEYIIARRGEGAKGQTIIREVQCLKRGLDEAHERGWIAYLPPRWPKVRRDPISPKQRGKLHPPKIIAQWLKALPEDARDEAEVTVLTGLRAAEVRRITAQWIEPAPEEYGVDTILRVPAASAKNRRERIVPLVPRALAILRRRAESLPEDGGELPLLAQGSHKTAYRLAAKRIGYGARITLRDLRHTWATLATRAEGVDVARDGLGHSDLSMTSRYITADMTRLASASLAIAKQVGTRRSAQSGKESRKCGRGSGIRTHDPLLPKQLSELLDHVSTCKRCAAKVRACMKMAVCADDPGTEGRHMPRAKGGRS